MNNNLSVLIIVAISSLLLLLKTPGNSQIMIDPETEFTSSTLPIIFIDTYGKEIEDVDRIPAHMGIIFNGQDSSNQVSDEFNDYDGRISIETRGSFSQLFPKKSYRFETHDAQAVDQNVSLLGMPSENDWILYAPYLDLSMIRNVLAFGISNDVGRYASRTRFCELVLNEEYRGVYVLMEKIKRDKDRVDIAKMDENDIAGDALTGGYIIKIDKISGENIGWWISNMGVQYQYDYPKPDRIVGTQKEYIKDFMNDFESAINSSSFSDSINGYPAYIDIGSFVDHFILNELFRNIDAYRISAFLHKHRDSDGGKLNAGPIWDFNLSAGLAFFEQDAEITEGWVVHYNQEHPDDDLQIPFWWERIAHESNFQSQAAKRWSELRTGVLDMDDLMVRIDNLFLMLKEARSRNWFKWADSIKSWLRPFDPTSFEEDSSLIKQYFNKRITWLDEQFDSVLVSVPDEHNDNKLQQFELVQNYPNPFNPSSTIEFTIPKSGFVELKVYNILGKEVTTLVSKKLNQGEHNYTFDGSNLGSGVYYYQLIAGEYRNVKKMILLK